MKSLPVGELKAQFSDVLEQVQRGETFEVLYGRNKKPVARIVPISEAKPKKRKLGILEGKAKVIFADDFKMTEEEFINLGKR
ncbi:MAG: type II toxin-antitoxin system prevent-host-death family antitoxin [Acidobacteria bacterium]|nr:type II toxin-antitoxin system prevent-host-death family antitoxin [Acidobacteriota bacterium]